MQLRQDRKRQKYEFTDTGTMQDPRRIMEKLQYISKGHSGAAEHAVAEYLEPWILHSMTMT